MYTGYLLKKGGSRGNWRRRYFILQNDELSYFASPEMLKPLGSISVRGCRIEADRAAHRGLSGAHVFVAIPPKAEGARVFFMAADSENEMMGWMLALKKAAGAHSSTALRFANPSEVLSDALGNKFFRPLREGFLEVQGKGNLGKWKNRFVVCRKNVLLLFESKEAVALHSAVGVIPLVNCTLEVQQPQKRLMNNVAYRTVSRKVGIESRREFKWNVQHAHRRHYMLSAPNEDLMGDWIAVCAAAVGQTKIGVGAGSLDGDSSDSFLSTIGGVSMSGELVCSIQGKSGSGDRKFVVVSENVLFFCRDSKSQEASSALDLENATVKEVPNSQGQFSLTYMGATVFLFDCRSANLRAAWLDALTRAVENGRRLNVEARMRLNGDTSATPSSTVVREVEQFSEDRSRAGLGDETAALEEADYATTQQLPETAIVEPRSKPSKPSAAAQRPVWGKKPSQQLMPRESKAVGQYRKPVLPANLKAGASFSIDDNDELLGLLNDPIFAGTPPKAAAKAAPGKKAVSLVCLNCGLSRLDVEANFCDGCGQQFSETNVNAYNDDELLDDVISLDDSEKAFLEANGTSEAEVVEVKKELVRVSTFQQGPPSAAATKKNGPSRDPPAPPVLNTSLVKADRRSSRNVDFRPMRSSKAAVNDDDEEDDSYMTLPALPELSTNDGDDDDDDDDPPTPPPRTSMEKRKMQLAAAKKKIDDDDPLAMLDLLDWDDDPIAKKKEEDEAKRREQEKRDQEKRRQSVARREREEAEEEAKRQERKEKERKEEAERKRRLQEEEERERREEAERREAAERRRREEERERKLREEERERKLREEERERRLREEEQERKLRQLEEERERKAREEEAERKRRLQREAEEEEDQRRRREQELKERELRLRRMEIELQEKEMEAKRRELAALAALQEAEELKRRARALEEEKKEQARREQLMREEEARAKEEELVRKANELARKEQQLREEAERKKREEEAARKERLRRKEEEEALARKEEEMLARKEEELRMRQAELARKEREAREAEEAARVEKLEASRRARDAAKKLKEAKERELEELRQREQEEEERRQRAVAEAEKREKEERLRRAEEERKRREDQEEREREEQRRKEAEWAELRSKMEKQREKEKEANAAPAKKSRFTPEDAERLEQLKTLRDNQFIEQREFEARVKQILDRYPEGTTRGSGVPENKKQQQQQQQQQEKQQEKSHVAVVVTAAAPASAKKSDGKDTGKSAPCPKCSKSVNVNKRFCPHCGFDTQKKAQQPPQKQPPKKAVADKIPDRLKPEDRRACLQLKELLDEGLMEVDEYNARLAKIIERSSLSLEGVAAKMEADRGDEHLEEFSRVLQDPQPPSARKVDDDEDDAALLRSIGLTEVKLPAKKTVHDEGLSELDNMLKQLGENP